MSDGAISPEGTRAFSKGAFLGNFPKEVPSDLPDIMDNFSMVSEIYLQLWD
ncbi:Ferredoxin-dependent glutamate synthase [hydrothermal vent metagenome]|uniref:Ferredoxin-dependent glutamate synthase n=1 Tax=hydrothermal vent metagenome TaxID=652676 RepID=A0A1W1CLE3_9ZZZZ